MRKQRKPVLALVVAAAFITTAIFLPKLTGAGSLEPTAPPGSTMKTLDEIPPTWSQKLDSTNGSTTPLYEGCDSSRFECIWYEGEPFQFPQAVLDKETGLVWDRYANRPHSFDNNAVAHAICIGSVIGGRMGWRLPTISELQSLIDTTQSDPALPNGHPFRGVWNGYYWSSTMWPGAPDRFWTIHMCHGVAEHQGSSWSNYVWRVRGPE